MLCYGIHSVIDAAATVEIVEIQDNPAYMKVKRKIELVTNSAYGVVV